MSVIWSMVTTKTSETLKLKTMSTYGVFKCVAVSFLLLVCVSNALNEEGRCLLEMKKNMRDDFDRLAGWNSSEWTPCGWTGVTCAPDNNGVSRLNLASMNLSGTISSAIGCLVHLTFLDLSFNKFSGSIPVEIGKCSMLQVLHLNDNKFNGSIPPSLGSLSSLTDLNLCENKLSGSIPDEIGNLTSLGILLAHTNNLSGSVPPSIGKLKKLITFRAGHNQISGEIPAEISGCESLEILGLSQSRLTGEIPRELGLLKNLKRLVLWENSLSGVIPKELGNCSYLQMIALYKNSLNGEIPVELMNLKFLQKLYLYRNSLNGTIPKDIGNLSQAIEIDLSENSLSGGIPRELANVKDLNLLYLFQNHLTGEIPAEICTLKNLTMLDLSINCLNGTIPHDLQNLTKLIRLQLFDNKLTGGIPQGLGLSSPLSMVQLSKNNLSGKIPPHLCRHSSLSNLNLMSNKLTGDIPSGIMNCKSLVQISLGANSLTGSLPSSPIPSDVRFCNLVWFNISSNNLSGTIPPEVVNCSRLQRLDLSRNSFRGTIPNVLGTLQQLKLLYVSDNQFSGGIPPVLGNLPRLMALKMGGNNFSGSIPKELGRLSLSLQIELNLSCNNLSGSIPQELGNLALLMRLLLNDNHLSGQIPSTFEKLSSLLEFNVSYNNLTGPLPSKPIFQAMSITSFMGNKGLCGGKLGRCGASSQTQKPDRTPLGRIIAIIAAAVGGVSLFLIVVMAYLLRRPVKSVGPLEAKKTSSPAGYIFSQEGFTFNALAEATNDFDDSFFIGSGACGTVYKAILSSGQTVAVKKLASHREGNLLDNSFQAEISTLGKIRHRNIVRLFGFCHRQGSDLLIYEYMSRGSLGNILHGTSYVIDWETRYTIALGAAEGLSYLHHDCKPRIIHRDIKSNNILLDDNFEAHVGDFGLAKVIDMSHSRSMSAVAGSYGYIAPEYAYTMKVTEKSDIYSYGVVLLELLTGRGAVQPLDQGGDLVTLVRSYVRDNSLSPGLLDGRLNLEDARTVNHMIAVLKIALLCTTISPLDRPSMRQVVQMLMECKVRNGSFMSLPVSASSPMDDHNL